MFNSVNVTYERRVLRRGLTVVEFLLQNPHIAEQVKSVSVWRVDGFSPDSRQRQAFEQVFESLRNLQSVQIQELDGSTFPLIELMRESGRPLNVTIAHHIFGEVYDGVTVEHMKSYLALSPRSSLSLNLDAHMPSTTWKVLKPILLSMPAVKALKFRQYLSEAHRVAVPPSKLDYNGLLLPAEGCTIWGLEEFHVSDVLLKESIVESEIFSALNMVNWGVLKRLSLSGRAMVEDFFPRAVQSLSSLESLKLSSPNPRSFLYAAGLVGSAYDHSIPAPRPLLPENSPFLKMSRLAELSLDGASNTLPPHYFASPSLNHLRLHLRETFYTSRTHGARCAEDVKLLSNLSSAITRLEVDIGEIANLWHLTAVPGVDVDVRIYQILQAITAFPKLRFLRLFPPFIVKGTQRNRFPIHRQPLSDEQAVRIFRRLKSERSSLEILSIAADPVVAKDAVDFDCMSWTVIQSGCQILLVTRQANKSYEQRQIWEGERRLRTEIKRFSYPKPYLPEAPGWTFD